MRRITSLLLPLRNTTYCTHNLLRLSPSASPTFTTRFRFSPFSSESDGSSSSSDQNPTRNASESALAHILKKNDGVVVEDVSNKDFVALVNKHWEGDNEVLPSIMEAIVQRRMSNKHVETDDELMEELRMPPVEDIKDEEFESDFEELYSTDEEIQDLYNAPEYVKKKMLADEHFNMDERKWDKMVKDAMEQGVLKNTKECEEILEDMLSWDKLLPDDLKRKVEKKFDQLGDMCERGELEPEEAYELFKHFEDGIVAAYMKKMEAEGTPKFDETAAVDKEIDDPPGVGPILRWQTRVVFSPGGDAWHPKNRKVKMSVTVKDLGLSKHQFRRLRALVGKRYDPGRDELTITSERFEYREANRKDCLRTLYALLEEAGKANRLAEDARVSYVKERLRANPAFMDRLNAKIARQTSHPVSA